MASHRSAPRHFDANVRTAPLTPAELGAFRAAIAAATTGEAIGLHRNRLAGLIRLQMVGPSTAAELRQVIDAQERSLAKNP